MRKIASIFVLTTLVSSVLTACSLFGGEETPPTPPSVIPPTQTQPGAAAAPVPVAAAAPAPVAAAVPTPVAATPPTPTGDALIDKLNNKKFEIAPAATATSALLKQILKKNTPQSYQLQLPGPPYCQTIVAAAADTVADINVKLLSPTGAVEAQDATAESIASIAGHCPTIPGSYKLTVEIPNGEGEFAVQVFSK